MMTDRLTFWDRMGAIKRTIHHEIVAKVLGPKYQHFSPYAIPIGAEYTTEETDEIEVVYVHEGEGGTTVLEMEDEICSRDALRSYLYIFDDYTETIEILKLRARDLAVVGRKERAMQTRMNAQSLEMSLDDFDAEVQEGIWGERVFDSQGNMM